jgi:hypothetical protein
MIAKSEQSRKSVPAQLKAENQTIGGMYDDRELCNYQGLFRLGPPKLVDSAQHYLQQLAAACSSWRPFACDGIPQPQQWPSAHSKPSTSALHKFASTAF